MSLLVPQRKKKKKNSTNDASLREGAASINKGERWSPSFELKRDAASTDLWGLTLRGFLVALLTYVPFSCPKGQHFMSVAVYATAGWWWWLPPPSHFYWRRPVSWQSRGRRRQGYDGGCWCLLPTKDAGRAPLLLLLLPPRSVAMAC